MSYDITFKVKVDGVNRYIEVGECEANTTWNVRKMIEESTGLPWVNEANNGLCKDVMPKIYDGRKELYCYPEKYKQYEASNGWGTVESTRRFFGDIIGAWESLCLDDEELASVATFWIE